VLLEVLNAAGVQLEELITLVLVTRGHFTVLPGTSTADQLLTALPVRSSISSCGACLDMALPGRAGGDQYYCEADTMPFMVLSAPLLEPEVVAAMPGLRLSLVVDTPFEALRSVDPPIESARIVNGLGGPTLGLVLDMGWVSVPVRRALQAV
jgi:hypothetical protein